MKVGILTLDKADNYGAVLQAYALQTILSKFGIESEIIDKENQETASTNPVFHSRTAAALMKRLQEEEKKRKAGFQEFRDKYLRYSPKYTKDTMSICNTKYDCFIAGSDQIWNMYVKGADTNFFLPFADPDKRFSYAASFGGEDIPKPIKEWGALQLKQFAGLSVREESGRDIIRELTQREAQVCLDPTMLLEKEDWFSLIQPSTDNNPYFLLYMLQYNKELIEKAQKHAEKNGALLVTVTSTFHPEFGFSSWNSIGVVRWLELIANAKGVFTDSFHGTVFSLLFCKPLFVSEQKGNLANRNERIINILNKIEMIECLSQLHYISAERLNERIGQLKQESIDYLKGIIAYARSNT